MGWTLWKAGRVVRFGLTDGVSGRITHAAVNLSGLRQRGPGAAPDGTAGISVEDARFD
jgi:hypothetical protein